ncbi:hypothetical protein [Kineococcus rhizosphaerae]|uniref:hypothetical protein n=1 Tax=Kineococcus rhizosphaerae TaxID=559628 RepID=UPI000D07903B|nr:hypothetical protein [Kineococcus rhizosphaerae]
MFARNPIDRRRLLAAGFSTAILGGIAAASAPVADAVTTTQRPTPGAAPAGPGPAVAKVVGVLGSDARTAPDLRAAGLTSVTLQVAWDAAQPTPGTGLDAGYVAQLRARIAAYRAQGLSVVLDTGLQYAPAWVLKLPDALFVDQFGTAHTATTESGENVPDAVWNPRVRSAQAAYLAALASALGRTTFSAIRVGGLLTGELRFPRDARGAVDATTGTGSWWSFSRNAQTSSPVPGYRPGISKRDQAKDAKFLEHYLSSLAAYQDFLVGATTAAFSGDLLLMYPSFGVRTGDRAGAVAAALSRKAVRYSELVQGLDFSRLVARAATYPVRAVAYSTWLDGPEFGPSDQDLSPVAFLARQAAPLNLAVGGENTADSAEDLDALRTCQQRAAALGLSHVFWFNDLTVNRDPVLAKTLARTFS